MSNYELRIAELELALSEKSAQLDQRTEELAVINSVQDGLAKKMDIQSIYELVGEKIRHIFNAQIIDIVTYDSATNLLDDRYAYEKGDRTLVGTWEPSGFRELVIKTGQLLLINEELEERSLQFKSTVIHGSLPKSVVFVPLKTDNEVKGMISLQDLDKEHAFSDNDVSLLTTLANSMSVALDNARLFDETTRLLKQTEQRTAELAVINSVQEGLARELDITAIYDLVGEKMREIFNAQVIDIVTYDKTTNLIEDRYSFEKGDRSLVGPREPKGFRKHVIDSGEMLLHNHDVEEASIQFGNEVLIGEMAKSQIFFPMIASGKVVGIISLQNLDHENAFSDSDVNLLTTLANSMSVALESARHFNETISLLKQTEQRTAELAVINSVQEGLAREMDIQGIYELVGEKMREIFNAQVIDIVTYDRKSNLIEDRYAYEKGDRSVLGPREPKGFRKHVIETGEMLLHNSGVPEASVQYGNELLIGEMAKSQVFFPLTSSGKVAGVISLQNLDYENAFTDSDISLLTTLANSMSVALESARLFDETTNLLKQTEQRTAELGVINSVQEGLARELDIQAIYELVGEKIREIFNAQVIDIVTYDKRTDLIEDRYAYEKGDRTLIGQRKPKGFRKHLFETGQLIVINKDYEEKSVFYNNTVLIGDHPKSVVLVPMKSGNVVTGVISLQNLDKEDAFSDSDISLLTTLANSMSVALENARLFDETNRLLKETEQRNAELAVINSVQESLVAKMDIQGIYELVGEKIREIFNAQVIDIVTYDPIKNLVEDQYSYEKGDRTLLGPRSPKGFRKHVIHTRQTLVINDHADEMALEYNNEVMIGEKPKSFVLVPLIAGGDLTGIISLQNVDKEHAFPESDVKLLTTLANSMSVALENARLFDETSRLLKETEQRTAELAVINSVQEGLARELDIQSIYDLVGDRIRELFKAQGVIIANLDQEKGVEHFKYAMENGKRFYLQPRPLDKLRQHLIKTKQKIVINKNFEEAFANFGMKVAPGTELPQSALYVPLIIGDKITSYVSLQNVDEENAFSESDVRLLETLSNSMSVALENARLFDETNRLLKETEQRTAELAVINSVQEGLARELDMQAIYDLVGERIRDIFDAQAVIIANLDLEARMEIFKYALENGERYYLDPRPLDKLRKHLVQTKQKVVINNAGESFVWFGNKTLPGTKPMQSGAFVPLIIGNKITSYISLQNVDKEEAFSDSDIRLLETLANSMSVALENARLFDETNRLLKETEQRTAELAVINGVQDGLARELDIQAIYNLVGDRLCALFPDTQTLVIRTFDNKTMIENFQYAIEKGERMQVDSGPMIWANRLLVKTRQSLLINENYEEISKKYGGTGVTKGQPPKSAVFVPMIVGDVVKGSISLQNVDKEDAFTDSDLRLLTTLCNSMSVALENARLFDETTHLLKETEQHKAELAVINSVQEGLVREMDMKAIYELVGNRICELFDTQTVLIRTFNHKTGNEEWQFAIEKGERLYSKPRPFNWANQLIIKSKQSVLINENYSEIATQHGGTGVTKGLPPKSAVFVPMIVGDVVRGSVSLQNVEKEHAFSDADLRLLTTLTNSMSVALENARLFDETAHLLAEAKQRASELTTVNSISKALASRLDPAELIKLVGDQLRDLFSANIVYLAVVEESTNTIYFPYQFGDNMLPMPLGEGLTSKIILTGQPLLVNKDVNELSQQLGFGQVGIPASSYLGVPIPVGEEIIGVLSVQSTEQENRFNESDQRLLSTIAASVGVALRNAKLFEEVQQSKMEAEAASKVAEKANEAKSAFLSTVSHELRTPLTSVLGFTKIIRKRLDEKIFPLVNQTDAKTTKAINQVSENLQVVISEGERLTNLINDVLDLAKIEAGKMEWNSESVSLFEVTERGIAATASLFDQKPITLEKNIDKNLPPIEGDRDKLIQVIINLISNAVKFTDHGSVTCKLYKKANEIIFSVSDTGIGIAPGDFGAVFEQFKQVGGDTLTDKPKGTGLGLPICKEIIDHHDGRIWLDSEVGKGSTFSFAIPFKNEKVAGAKPMHLDALIRQLKEQVLFSKIKTNGKNATILVVDDEDSIRSLLHQELNEAGYLVEEASNGKEALESIRINRPDLIILDIMMPELNGFDLAAILKNDPETMDIPIIVLSIIQDKARGFRIGVDRYLTKPIDTARLFTEVGTLLEQGKSKKKVMVVDEDQGTVNTLTDVLKTKGYLVVESNEKELVENAIAAKPDIIIINSLLSGKHEIVQTLRFEMGLENVVFLVYQ